MKSTLDHLLNFVALHRRSYKSVFITLLSIFLVRAYDRTFMTAPNMMAIDNSQALFFEVIYPEALNYLFKLRPAKDFGVPFYRKSFHHSKVVPTDPLDACSQLQNREGIKNSIALVQRGSCSFLSKANIVESAGAIAMFVMDYDKDNDEKYIEMVGDNTGRKTNIPAGFVLGRDGYHIQRVLKSYGLQHAIVNIPVNVTTSEIYLKQPPWTIW